ncbi:TniB family NTP-binding protein [uncultured Tateyamaria sp.]|uniref:TniB family NTP-binding protein n=1 Tax=uncultured Tateyamaria sp. TaxID=455651 RepID=UPI002607A47A|nr:TniB family NTP-binding protein [uncultured Tateyamaria sp.]
MDLDERLDLIRSDRWIAFDRATIVLNRLTSLMEMPRQSRMPGLMVYGSSGIGKTMIAKRMESLYPSNYRSDLGVTRTPILLLQVPPAPDERRFYQHILASISAPMWGRHTISELEVRALSHFARHGSEDDHDRRSPQSPGGKLSGTTPVLEHAALPFQRSMRIARRFWSQ